MKVKGLKILHRNRMVVSKIRDEFDLTEASVLSLMAGIYESSAEPTEEEIGNLLPKDILAYKYLMHPVRLSILKILYNEDQISSIGIKNGLGLSWGEYRNHLKSLETKKYVEVNNQFDENGKIVQIVSLLEFGRKQYKLLFELLKEFTDKGSLIHEIMDNAPVYFDDKLYPPDRENENTK